MTPISNSDSTPTALEGSPAIAGRPIGVQMKLTIFAATGGVGRQLLEQAVAAGHDVTAVARNPSKLTR